MNVEYLDINKQSNLIIYNHCTCIISAFLKSISILMVSNINLITKNVSFIISVS